MRASSGVRLSACAAARSSVILAQLKQAYEANKLPGYEEPLAVVDLG